MFKLSKFAIITVTALTVSTPALAKDWIEKVSLKPYGIDTVPIEVVGDGNRHTKTKKSKHQFKIEIYAKAKKNKRIVAGKVGSEFPTRYFESGGVNRWSQKLSQQAVAGGKKQGITYVFGPHVSLSKVTWQGHNPVQACNHLVEQKMKKGQNRLAVLTKTWTTSANAYFEVDMVAAKKKAAKKGKWNIKNTTSERKTMTYRVTVKCNPTIKLQAS